jgi:hypothetical protein
VLGVSKAQGRHVTVPRIQGLYGRFVAGDVLYIGKPPLKTSEALEEWLAVAKYFSANGARVILDYTDHHLEASPTSLGHSFYSKICPLVSDYSVPSRSMRDLLVAMGTPADVVHVIPDPFEYEPRVPTPASNDRTSLTGMWFGHQSNAQHLWSWLDKNDVPEAINKLVLVTSVGYLQSMEFVPGKWNVIERLGGLQVLPVAWSLTVLSELASKVDYSLVISDPADKTKAGASSNRLVTSLCLGLPTIASSMNSYEEFENFFTAANNAEQLREFFLSLDAQREKVARFQSLFASQFSPSEIDQRWRTLLQTPSSA